MYRLPGCACGGLHAQPLLVARRSDRGLPRCVHGIAAAANHLAGGQPFHAVALVVPEWGSERTPTARDLAKAAAEKGVPYTLVTGLPQGNQHIENALATPLSVMVSETIERFDAVFTGAGDTLSATVAGLLAMGDDLEASVAEAFSYLDGALDAGFRPGMGHALADRLFWAQAPDDADEADEHTSSEDFLPGHDTRH